MPRNTGALYISYVKKLTSAFSGCDVVSLCSDELHSLTERIIIQWEEDTAKHQLDLKGNLFALLYTETSKKPPALQLRLVF